MLTLRRAVYCSTHNGEHLVVFLEWFTNQTGYVRLATAQLSLVNSSTGYHSYSYKLDERGNRLEFIRDNGLYDPRTRPWYKAALQRNRPTWSEVYLDLFSEFPTITASQPVYAQTSGKLIGVCAVDVLLPKQLRSFLSSLQIGKHGKAFVIEQGLIPDLILLDMMMPRMTGYEVCQKIRDRFPSHELPLVTLTAKNQVENIVEGFARVNRS